MGRGWWKAPLSLMYTRRGGRERVLEFKREGEVGDSGWQMRDGMLEVFEKLQVSEGGQRREGVIEAFVES